MSSEAPKPKIVAVTHGQSSTQEAPSEKKPRSTRSSRSARKHRRKRRGAEVRYLRFAVAVAVLAILVLMISNKFSSDRLEAEAGRLTIENRKLARELAANNETIAELRSSVDELMAGRLPDALPLEYDVATRLGDGYVRNVIFSLTGKGGEKVYEYRMVMKNDSLSVLFPSAKILLFDAAGMQVGKAEVTSAAATTRQNEEALDPGESRSYSAVIEMERPQDPHYFMVIVE